jgi:hypothetical protein
MEITTPSGHKVTLKNVDEITHGDRKRIMIVDENTGRLAQGFELMDNLLAVAVTAWDYDLVPPVTRKQSLDALSPADYDAITEAAGPLMEALAPKLGKSDDPKAPSKK